MKTMLAVLPVVWLGSGCVQMAKYRIDPKELTSLDGFDAKNERTMSVTVPTMYVVGKTMVNGSAQVPQIVTDKPYRLIHPSGRAFDFNSGMSVAFLTAGGSTELLHWRSIAFGGGTLAAVPMKAAAPSLNIPTTDLQGAVIEVPSYGRTFLTAGLVTLGAGAALGLGGWAAYAADNRNVAGALIAAGFGGSFLFTGAIFALVSLAMDRHTDADAEDLKLGTLGSSKKP